MLKEIDDPGVELVRDPLDTVRRLKAEDGGMDIWLTGGGRLAAALLPECRSSGNGAQVSWFTRAS